MNDIGALIFDLFDTLVDWHTSTARPDEHGADTGETSASVAVDASATSALEQGHLLDR